MQPIMTPCVVIVGADKGGVGKTTASLALLDFYNEKNISCRGKDTEYPQGILQRFAPAQVDIVDLTRPSYQVKVFDTLKNWSVTLIDIRAGLLSKTLTMLNSTGFFESAKSGNIRIVVMHILGDTEASYDEVAAVSTIIPDARRILVKNYMSDTSWEDGTQIELRNGDELMEIPNLVAMAAKAIDKAGVSPAAFVANESNSETLRGYTRTWRKQVNAAFSRANLDTMTT